MNVLIEKSLFKTDDISIDFFSWDDNPHKNIALTFTPFGTEGEVSLNGVGYGGELLLRNGFDVVAFKSAKNLWYQNLSPETIANVENFISLHSSQYKKRVGYGSSMGGYAVIQFSRDLKLDVVLALSPQFEIDKPYDQRWQAAAKEIDFQYRINASAILDDCKYFIAYDPETADVRHVEKLRELIDESQLVEIKTPYSGHPSAYYLAETGLIQELALSVLKNSSADHIRVGAHRKRSKTYLYELSKRLALQNKNKSALVAINKAISIDGNAPAFHHHKSIALNRLGDSDGALISAYVARDKLTNEAHLMGAISELLANHCDFSGALVLIEKAISLDSNVLEFHLHKYAVCKALNDVPNAISAGEAALALSPDNASLMARLSRLHARQGGMVHWTRSFKLGKRAIFTLFK